VAVNSTETTTFTVSVNDHVAPAVINNATTVVSTSGNDAPTIGNFTTTTTITDIGTATPFSTVTIADADSTQIQTVTVSFTAANGILSNLGGGTITAPGTYTFIGTAAAAQTAIRGLVFTPTANHVAVGSTEQTTFTLSVNDGIAPAVTDSTTTVVATSVNDAPTVGGVTAITHITDTVTATPFSTFTINDVDTPAQTKPSQSP